MLIFIVLTTAALRAMVSASLAVLAPVALRGLDAAGEATSCVLRGEKRLRLETPFFIGLLGGLVFRAGLVGLLGVTMLDAIDGGGTKTTGYTAYTI